MASDLAPGFEQLDMRMAPTESPWGRVEHVQRIAPGIWMVDTAGHGGFFVAASRLKQMPIQSTRWSSGGWFEEDRDAALVVHQWPELFTAEQALAAEKIVARCFPQLLS